MENSGLFLSRSARVIVFALGILCAAGWGIFAFFDFEIFLVAVAVQVVAAFLAWVGVMVVMVAFEHPEERGVGIRMALGVSACIAVGVVMVHLFFAPMIWLMMRESGWLFSGGVIGGSCLWVVVLFFCVIGSWMYWKFLEEEGSLK